MNARVAFHAAVEAPRGFRALRMSRPQIDELAIARLRWLLGHAPRTRLYRRNLERAGLQPSQSVTGEPTEILRALPLVDKGELLSAGETALDGGRVHPEWLSSRSSGSTGEPFRVHYDPRAWAILKLVTKARSRWACGVRPWDRIAILDAFSPEEGRHSSNPVGRVRRVNVATSTTEEIAAELAVFRPDVIYGLPSVLLEMMHTEAAPMRPRTIFTSGELLTAGTRSRLEEGYDARVHDIYGSTETKEVAWECRRGSLHINLDVVHVEVVDDDGQPLPAGHEGRIVVTVLVNAAMPLIRYVTGDRGSTLSSGCACGVAMSRLGLVAGRETDYLDLGAGRRLSPYSLTCALESIPGIRRFQVVQRSSSHLGVRIQPHPDADLPSLDSRVRKALSSMAPVPLTVSVDFDGRFELGPGGKFRVVHPLHQPV